MKLSTRYGLVGIAALSALSLVHWGRESHYDGPEIVLYLMGVLPNVAAAIAIPFVLLSIWADQNQGASYAVAHRRFVVATLGAGVALVGWELIQQSSRTLVYDTHDIGATILGLGVGWLLFTRLTRNISGARRATIRARRVEETARWAEHTNDDVDPSNR